MTFLHQILRISGVSASVFCACLTAQSVQLLPAAPIDFPGKVDSNSPAYVSGRQMFLFNSAGTPTRSRSLQGLDFVDPAAVSIAGPDRKRWIESVWHDRTSNRVYAWYHTEPEDVCPGQALTAPEIGALVSDDGVNFRDLGIVLASGDAPDCGTENRYFAGGHGDFTVIPDRDGAYFYFLFTNYGGPLETQGVGLARMRLEDRDQPVGAVFKLFEYAWNEPGIGGLLTPIFPARLSWADRTPDAFWGPSVHWNRELNAYVVLLSHATDYLWSQEGIYVTASTDLSDPWSWSEPQKLLEGYGWYPQILGLGPGETDSVAGATARLFIMGHSEWTLQFGALNDLPETTGEHRTGSPR